MVVIYFSKFNKNWKAGCKIGNHGDKSKKYTPTYPLVMSSCQTKNIFPTKTWSDWQSAMYDKTKNIAVPSTTSAQVKNLQV